MKHLKNKTSLTPFGVLLALLLAVLPTQSAHATQLEWPIDGDFVVGDAQWRVDEYGLAYGWDVGDIWNNDGYIYYPNEFRFGYDANADDLVEYFMCGDPSNFDQETVVTTLPSGAIQVECPEVNVPLYSSLTAKLTFLIYPETETGHLVRQVVAVTNSSSQVVYIPDLEMYNFPNLHTDYTAGSFSPGIEAWFLDSVGLDSGLSDSSILSAGSNWYSQGMLNGDSVFLTNSWSVSGSAQQANYVPTLDYESPYIGASLRMRTSAPNAFAPAKTTNLLTFTNMVLPASNDPASAVIAQTAALSQTQEFDSFSGRLVDGLPECTEFIGWGVTPGTCELSSGVGGTPNSEPCYAELAQTGINLLTMTASGITAAAIGTWLLLRKRKSDKSCHSPINATV